MSAEFVGSFVGLLVGFSRPPDKPRPIGIKRLGRICRVCRVFIAGEGCGEFGLGSKRAKSALNPFRTLDLIDARG